MDENIKPEDKPTQEALEATSQEQSQKSREVIQEQREVKEKRLANLRPFAPGQSGNPGGKPKGETASSMIREIGREMVITTDGIRMSRWQAMYRRLFELALDKKGKAADRVKATEFLTEHGFGKALERIHQEIDLSGGAIVPKAIIPTENGAIPTDPE